MNIFIQEVKAPLVNKNHKPWSVIGVERGKYYIICRVKTECQARVVAQNKATINL